MRSAASFLCVTLIACAAPAQEPRASAAPAIALRNAGFEAPPRPGERCPIEWSCTMHSNPESFTFTLETVKPAAGARSLCIERVHPEPWSVASQTVPARELRGRKLRFSIAIRGERLAGPGGGPWVLVNGPGGMLMHEERVAMAGAEWERRAIEFVVPAQAEALEVGATLLGAGRLCIDDARLEAA